MIYGKLNSSAKLFVAVPGPLPISRSFEEAFIAVLEITSEMITLG